MPCAPSEATLTRSKLPTAAYAPFDSISGPGSVSVARLGQAPLDDFCEYEAFNCNAPKPGIDPRFGDYGAAAVSGGTIFFANEYVESNCTFERYVNSGFTCGDTRAPLANWSTRISRFTP